MRFVTLLRRKTSFLLLVACIVCAGAGAYAFMLYTEYSQELVVAQTASASSTALYNTYVKQLKERLALAMSSLETEQMRNAQFSSQFQSIQGTVQQIQKTNATDKELLQKYSKVYFLNENYVPARLAPIATTFLNDPEKVLVFESDALPFLTKMFEGALADSISLKVISSYRSFGDQASLKSSYKVTYGSGANSFSADQGYSEHQLGTAVDVSTAKLGTSFTQFASSNAYTWMQTHAHEYGFILSYPKDNAYYQFEPWHWRFVGVALATKLYDEHKNFYDLDQRDIDQYRAVMFDQ